MSINKVYLPEAEKLKESLKERGSNSFYMFYVRKRETFIGSNKSIKFIDIFCKKYFKNETTEFNEIN